MKFLLILISSLLASPVSADYHWKELKPEVKAAVKECHSMAGLKKGERPSKESRKMFKECMRSKGLSKGHHKSKDKMRDLDPKI